MISEGIRKRVCTVVQCIHTVERRNSLVKKKGKRNRQHSGRRGGKSEEKSHMVDHMAKIYMIKPRDMTIRRRRIKREARS